MPLTLPEQTALTAVYEPDKLAVGVAPSPLEHWTNTAVKARNLSKDQLKAQLLEGETITLDTTAKDIKGIRTRAEGIGGDPDPATGVRTRDAPEKKRYDATIAGVTKMEDLRTYESLDPKKQKEMQIDVANVLEECPGGKEYFKGKSQKEKREIADRYIRTHKKDIAALLQENSQAIMTDERFDPEAASNAIFETEEAFEITKMERDQTTAQLRVLTKRRDDLAAIQAEFDAPAQNADGSDNRGAELNYYTSDEVNVLTSINELNAELPNLKRKTADLDAQIALCTKDPDKAKRQGLKGIADLKNEREGVYERLEEAQGNYDKLITYKNRLAELRKQKAETPTNLKQAQVEVDAKTIEERKKQVAVKKAADAWRQAKEQKGLTDEDLATVTKDMWKGIIRTCVRKDTEEMLNLIMSPEGVAQIEAELLTKLDRLTEADWTKKEKRWRGGTLLKGKWPRIPWIVKKDVVEPDVDKIDTAFTAFLGDKDGTLTREKVKTYLFGPSAGANNNPPAAPGREENWNSLSKDQQENLMAAYALKLTVRRDEALGMSLRTDEKRAILSGPFANALVKQGLLRNPAFADEVAEYGGIDKARLQNPSAETIQEVKGMLDESDILTLLMIGLSPLSMMTKEEKARD